MTRETYEFQNTLFRNSADVCSAIVGEWLTAGGMNTESDIKDILATQTDEEIADEIISGWGLLEIVNQDEIRYEDVAPVTWLESRGLSRNDLIAEIGGYRS